MKTRILFIVPQHEYLFRKLFELIFKEASQEDVELAVLKSVKANWLEKDLSEYTSRVFSYGSGLVNLESQVGISRVKRLACTVLSIRELIQEAEAAVLEFSPQLVITPDSYDPVLQAIHQLKPKLPIYYLQHSNIISKHGVLSNRSRVQNILTRLFTGISLNFSTTPPPFCSRKLTYILWSPLWSNNIDSQKYKIVYLPKIMINPELELRGSGNSPTLILVALNKHGYIGKEAWSVYAEFYKKALLEFKDRVVFKVHPNGDLTHARDYFSEFQVIKGDVNMSKVQVVISHWSSFIYESVRLNIPFILVNPANTFDLKRFRLDNYNLTVSTKEELSQKIVEVSEGSHINTELRDEFMKLHFGNALGSTPDKLFPLLGLRK